MMSVTFTIPTPKTTGTAKKWAGAIVTLLIFYYIYTQIRAEIGVAMDDIRLALTLVMFVWILNWMRKLLGSPRLALLFALVISYLIFFKHPSLLFTVFGLLFLSMFLKPYIEKAIETPGPPWLEVANIYKDLAEKSKSVSIVISPPGAWPFHYPPPYTYFPYYYGQQGGTNTGKKGDES